MGIGARSILAGLLALKNYSFRVRESLLLYPVE